MTRIIAGAARGRRLAVPPGQVTRPTSDRAREGLFSTLEALLGSLAGRRFADLYAGSGAVGLEALSRGAAAALLVESDARAARTVRANVEATGLPGAQLVTTKVERLVPEGPPRGPYDVVFLDPPYDLPAERLADVLAALIGKGWLATDAVTVVERASRDAPWQWPAGIVPERERRYGEATLWYGRAAIPPTAGE
jgi:16S rRNA (guanine966-N2)-methyltransferase